MLKIRSNVAILAAILFCAIAGCSSSSTHSGSPVTAAPSDNAKSTAATGSTDPSSPAIATAPTGSSSPSPGQTAGLLAYVPSSLASSCNDTGTNGHLPAVTGYSDSLSCGLGLNSPAEVDYYQYGSARDMKTAYNSASTSDYFDSPQRPGGCTSGSDEYGTWSTGSSVIGNIACPINNNNGVNLIWDDPRAKIIAVASAEYVVPADLYSWWQANGASIDGSAQRASSS
jgi:hypothetical protein